MSAVQPLIAMECHEGAAETRADGFSTAMDFPPGAELGARIASLEAKIKAQALTIRRQAAELCHNAKLFERAAAVARIGVWECYLADETLRWTNGVYDMFELARGSQPDRQTALRCYSDASAQQLQALRSKAIEERSGFELDAEIVTPRGQRRWIRVTATVECDDDKPIRIFGMKQDITEEKLRADRLRFLAEVDVMTGLANRSRFQARLSHCVEGGDGLGALLIVDLDGFKQVNDTFGHALGDECLKVAASRIAAVCEGADLVARIGGDEFAVLLKPTTEAASVDRLASQIVAALGAPIEAEGRRLQIGASIGIAGAGRGSDVGKVIGPSPGQGKVSSSEMFQRADVALYQAKAAGRGTFRRFSSAEVLERRA